MISYVPDRWGLSVTLSLKGSVIPRAVGVGCPPAVLSALGRIVLVYLGDYPQYLVTGQETLTLFAGFSFVLSFLVVFRSQQAYSRWWEGGTLLQQLRGEWFNSYSALISFCNATPENHQQVLQFQHQVVRLYSLLFGCALEQVSTMNRKQFEVISIDGMEQRSVEFLQSAPDRCEVVLQWLQRLIVESNASGLLAIPPPILSRVFQELGNGIVNLCNVRKITDYPFPFPLAQLTTVMLIFHSTATPIICSIYTRQWYWAFLTTFVVISAFWSVNFIALELEMPFGDDANDMPLSEMQVDMNTSLAALLNERAQRVPRYVFDHAVDRHLERQMIDFESPLARHTSKSMDIFAKPSCCIGHLPEAPTIDPHTAFEIEMTSTVSDLNINSSQEAAMYGLPLRKQADTQHCSTTLHLPRDDREAYVIVRESPTQYATGNGGTMEATTESRPCLPPEDVASLERPIRSDSEPAQPILQGLAVFSLSRHSHVSI